MPSKTRWIEIPCPRCHGEGGWITHTTGYAEPVDHTYVCEQCEGSGHVEVDYEDAMDAACGVAVPSAPERSWRDDPMPPDTRRGPRLYRYTKTF